ncbi:MAG TPA: MFS transporter [Gammaproteobacteria bacterium]|nr:MFS transporter [Gammaproteobacteria bacterium]
MMALLIPTVIFVSMGQSVYWQTMPLIGRELGFSVKLITSLVSFSALMFLIFTPYWGRLSDKKGRKFVLLIGLVGYIASTLLFCWIAYLGLIGYFTFTALIFFLLVARVINSALGAGMRPATGATVADVTTEENRSAGMGQFGAANNVGTILGPVLVSFIAFLIANTAIFPASLEPYGRLIPLLFMSFLMMMALVFVYFYLPESLVKQEANSSGQGFNFDKSNLMLISTGVLIFSSFAIIQSISAFYLQDTFSLSILATQQSLGIALGFMALTSIVAQLTIVQKIKIPPIKLVQWSTPFFILGTLVAVYADNFNIYVLGMSIIGLGMGLGTPGYTAAASLNADSESQGAAVGLAMVAPGLGFSIGPLLGGFLYESSPSLPFLAILPIFVLVFLIASYINKSLAAGKTL